MGEARHRSANRRLTWARLQKGWSYDELAAQLRANMARHRELDTGLTGNTVRRWETGERSPDPRFRKHLVLIFNQTADELGLLTAEELAFRPEKVDDELESGRLGILPLGPLAPVKEQVPVLAEPLPVGGE